jgi:hypothetical protein
MVMREGYKVLVYSCILFLLSTFAITTWYILDIGSSESNNGFVAVKNIATRFGFYGATMLTILFLLGYFTFKKIKNRWILAVCVLVLIGLLYLAGGWFLWYASVNSLVDDPFLNK